MNDYNLIDEGSRKHLLDLCDSREYPTSIDRILEGTELRLAKDHRSQPHGRATKEAWEELEVEEYLATPDRQIGGLPSLDMSWWLRHRTPTNRSPSWDLIARLSNDKAKEVGLLLVEAKAHETEIKIKDRKTPPTPTDKSKENHTHIARTIARASKRLSRLGCGPFSLSHESRYQLANRLTCAALLADMGYHIVLMYLGFTGDIRFTVDYFRSPDHWQRVFGGYIQNVVPQGFPERRFAMDNRGSLTMVIRSQAVRRPSGGAVSLSRR